MAAFLLWISCLTAAVADPLPDVVLLSVDTLRADVLGCYGSPHPVTPELDRFSETALIFDDAQCEIPLTGPSFSAMFTGRFPRELGVTRNGLKLPEDMRTLTRFFREHGYHCLAVQSNWTLRGKLCGLNRDFDVYDDELPQKRWGVYRGERRAADLLKAAEKHLKERPEGKPLFAWIQARKLISLLPLVSAKVAPVVLLISTRLPSSVSIPIPTPCAVEVSSTARKPG